MNQALRSGAGLALVLILLAGGCTSSAPGPAKASQGNLHAVAGGCAGTVVTDSLPPAWAQGGFTHKSTPWAVPWALGTGGSVVAYVFTRQLVATTRPGAEGSTNKVGWAIKDRPSTRLIEGRPLGMVHPVVSVPGSFADVPTAGCWTFRVVWGAQNEHVSTVNLEVLPAGTLAPT